MKKYIYVMTFLLISGLSFGTKLQSPNENGTLNNVIIINASDHDIIIYNNDTDGEQTIPSQYYLYSSNLEDIEKSWSWGNYPLPLRISDASFPSYNTDIKINFAKSHMAVVITNIERDYTTGKLKVDYFAPGGGHSPIIDAIKEWGMKINPMDTLINNPK